VAGSIVYLQEGSDIRRWRDHLKMFAQILEKSDPGSIDDFLTQNPNYDDVGKTLIACEIMEKQLSGCSEPKDPWYSYLWQDGLIKNCNSLEEFSENNLSIITFNYDTSLDLYLKDTMLSYFNQSIPNLNDYNHIKSIFESVPICHVRGAIPTSRTSLSEMREQPYKLNMAAGSLRLIADQVDPEIAQDWIATAEHIHLLGFGFHQSNIDLLNLQGAVGTISGTRYGLTEKEVEKISEDAPDGSGNKTILPEYFQDKNCFYVVIVVKVRDALIKIA